MSASLRLRHHGAAATTVVACLYVAVFGALTAAVLLRVWSSVPALALWICGLPTPLTLVLALSARRDRRALAARITVAVLAFPVALAFWASETDAPPQPASPLDNRELLDPARVFSGAAMVSDFPQPGIELARSAAFADGSVLMLRRFADAPSADAALTSQASALSAASVQLSEGRVGQLVRGADALLYLERHGRDLLQVQAADQAVLLSRIAAQKIPLPSTSLSVANELPTRGPWLIGLCVLHMLGFVAFVFWVASAYTRISPEGGTRSLSGAELIARILQLPAAGLSCSAGREGELVVVQYSAPEGALRSLKISLRVDEAAREVRVRELEGLNGAAPRNDEEADMRFIGEIGSDVSRPRARKLYGRTLQARLIEPARLALWAPVLRQGALSFPGAPAKAADSDDLVYAICALVIDAGFAWQPVLRLG